MPSGGGVWGGVGEPTICLGAPAVRNALFSGNGKSRISARCPLRDQNITPLPDTNQAATSSGFAAPSPGSLPMNALRQMTRRNFVRGIAASSTSPLTFPSPLVRTGDGAC